MKNQKKFLNLKMRLLEKIFPCLRRNQKEELPPLSEIPWLTEELALLEKVKTLRPISAHNDLKHLAEKRLLFQQRQTTISHDDFNFDVEMYRKDYKWIVVAELLSYKLINPIPGFLRSEIHKKFLMDESLEYIGIAHDGERCVFILGRHYSNR